MVRPTLFGIFHPVGLVFQVLMLVHFFRTRPETYWVFIIIFLGPLGAGIYFLMEVLPGVRWKLPVFERMERRKRKAWLEQMVAESPSVEAMAELAQIRAIEGENAAAVELFDQALARAPEDWESYYGRGTVKLRLGRPAEAVPDLEKVVGHDPSYKFHGGQLALAEAYEKAGDQEKAIAAYRAILARTTVSQAYYHLGRVLEAKGEKAEAKRLMQEIIAKQTGLPRYLRRQERPWVRRAKAYLKEPG